MAKYPDLPSFLYGNSMGCMIITTYLQRNPGLHLAGVVLSAPFFYLPEHLEGRDGKLAITPYIGPILKDFVLGSHIKKASVCLDESFMSRFLCTVANKGAPFMEPMGLV